MKFHIMFLASAILSSGCFSQPQQKSEKWDQGVLVWSRGGRLEALQAGQKTPSVLRAKFAIESAWNMSSDGKYLTFAAGPEDVDFFDASASRDYVFTVGFNAQQQVLLAAYGPKFVGNWDYTAPRFDRTGTKIAVDEGEIGQFMDSSSHHWVAIYDVKTRRRIFDSSQLIQKMPLGKTRDILLKQKFGSPSLSPDGQDLVAVAHFDDGDSVADSLKAGEKAPPTFLVHFDLKRKTGEILADFNGAWNPGFAWHPTQKKILFAGLVSLTDTAGSLFTFDFPTHKMTRLTQGNFQDTSPQWTLNGKSIVWIRSELPTSKTAISQVFRADADGKNARAILPQVRGASQIQIVPKIADWTRYRRLPVESLAGKDK